MPCMGALSDALVYGFEASDSDWLGEVVLAPLECPVFGSPGSKSLQFGGGPGCGHNSPSLPRIVPVRVHSKSVRVLPFPELDCGDWECGSSWLECVVGSGCFGVWVGLGGPGRLACGWMSFGPLRGPWIGEVRVNVCSGVSVVVLCDSACMDPCVLEVFSVGCGQLDDGWACMFCMNIRRRCEAFILPSVSTSSLLIPAITFDVLM